MHQGWTLGQPGHHCGLFPTLELGLQCGMYEPFQDFLWTIGCRMKHEPIICGFADWLAKLKGESKTGSFASCLCASKKVEGCGPLLRIGSGKAKEKNRMVFTLKAL